MKNQAATAHVLEASFSVALAGQPNTGKSTVFNYLTGQNQHVGNWPGKTVEKKEGSFVINDRLYRITDLPGTYGLSANSEEELIAREYLIRETPDLVLAVVNAAALARSLYLVAELIELKTPLIVVLNMMDVAEAGGRPVDAGRLQEQIGVPVVPMVASKNIGFDRLKEAIEKFDGDHSDASDLPFTANPGLRQALAEIHPLLDSRLPAPYPREWASLKLLEGDREIERLVRSSTPAAKQKEILQKLEPHERAGQELIDDRYGWISRVIQGVRPIPPDRVQSRTARLDRWATHPVFGPSLMIAVFILTTAVTGLLSLSLAMPFFEGMLALEQWAAGVMPASIPWLAGLAQGTIRGAGGVLCLVFPLAGFAAAFAFLEDIGYMARAAYLMDRLLAKIGLNGRAFLPLLYGGICNILGVWGTRVVDTQRARLMAIMLNPFIPCSAKTAVLVTISFIFFSPGAALLVVIGLYAFNLVMLCATGLLLDKTAFQGQERTELIMELPAYHRPNLKTIWNSTRPRITGFISKAGSMAVPLAMIVWWISYFPTGEINTSYLAFCARVLDPIGSLMGLDWRMVTSLLASMLNKEATVATMGIIMGANSGASLPEVLRAAVSPAGAIAFLTAQMLFLPCVWTMGVMYSESRSLKLVLGMMSYMVLVSFGAAIVAYQLMRLFI